ncbi:hypothetical protein AWV80_34795 [Cupriavidus sp. UYMU48A]|nr:hypothetical protein AWV80_34795 [Cupriavidus sp. UYMU48A]
MILHPTYVSNVYMLVRRSGMVKKDHGFPWCYPQGIEWECGLHIKSDGFRQDPYAMMIVMLYIV